MAQEISAAEIVSLIKTDPIFALKFGLDNNFEAFKKVMMQQGIMVQTKAEAINKLSALVNGDRQKLQNIYSKIPYLNLDPKLNYTGGLLEYFVNTSPADKLQDARQQASAEGSRFDLNAILSGLGAGLTGFTDYQAGASGGGAGTPSDPAVIAAAAAAAKAEAEAAAKKKKRNMWIAIGIVSAVVVSVVLYFVFRKKKPAPKAE